MKDLNSKAIKNAACFLFYIIHSNWRNKWWMKGQMTEGEEKETLRRWVTDMTSAEETQRQQAASNWPLGPIPDSSQLVFLCTFYLWSDCPYVEFKKQGHTRKCRHLIKCLQWDREMLSHMLERFSVTLTEELICLIKQPFVVVIWPWLRNTTSTSGHFTAAVSLQVI